tara:strand:- start:76 stop:702 length:627 start_codon:yes stop_codon:yes gene_type:complete
MADKKRRVIKFHVPGLAPKEEPPNTDPTKGFVAPPSEKKPAVQREPDYVKEFFDPSGTEKRREDRSKREENKKYPLGKHDSGYHVIKGPKVYTGGMYGLPREEAPDLRESTKIPVNSSAYPSVTDIKDTKLPAKAAEHFANMVLQLPTKSGRTMKDAYDEDVMYYMALLQDEHPDFDQTKENAERLLWKLPLKGGPQQPSRKKMIRTR